MSKDMAKSLVAAALMVAFSTPVAANTATGSHAASGAFSKQADGIVMRTGADGSNGSNNALGAIGIEYSTVRQRPKLRLLLCRQVPLFLMPTRIRCSSSTT